MPGQYSFKSPLLRLSFEGKTSLSALEVLLEKALSDPSCPTRPVVLADMRRSTSIPERTGDEMRQAVDLFNARRDRLGEKFAILTQTAVQYGMMQIAGAYSDNRDLELRIFEHEAAAIEWLGIS